MVHLFHFTGHSGRDVSAALFVAGNLWRGVGFSAILTALGWAARIRTEGELAVGMLVKRYRL